MSWSEIKENHWWYYTDNVSAHSPYQMPEKLWISVYFMNSGFIVQIKVKDDIFWTEVIYVTEPCGPQIKQV